MNVAAVTLLLAVGAVFLQAVLCGSVLLGAGGLVVPSLHKLGVEARAAFATTAIRVAFAVAAVAMAGSLYFSEVARYPPCRLCWYQRIAVYPLVPLLGIASVRRDGTSVRPFAMALPILGIPISSYHMLIERFPNLESSTCDLANPCSIMWIDRFGYLTIPTMALTAQVTILGLLLVAAPSRTPAGAARPGG